MCSHQPLNLNFRTSPIYHIVIPVSPICQLFVKNQESALGRNKFTYTEVHTFSLEKGDGYFFYVQVNQEHFQEEICEKSSQGQCTCQDAEEAGGMMGSGLWPLLGFLQERQDKVKRL